MWASCVFLYVLRTTRAQAVRFGVNAPRDAARTKSRTKSLRASCPLKPTPSNVCAPSHWPASNNSATTLSAIQRRSVSPEYFQTLALALKNAGVYRNCIISELGELDNPDMIGEVADILVRHEGIDWVLCSGVNNGKVWLSVRTTQTEASAGALMQSVVKKTGTGGGHEQSAGGQVRLTKGTKAELESVQKTVTERFLRGTGAGDERRRPLVSL